MLFLYNNFIKNCFSIFVNEKLKKYIFFPLRAVNSNCCETFEVSMKLLEVKIFIATV
jgi:hypothetical protein